MPAEPRVAVVAHDAGAANLAFAWIDAGLISPSSLYLEGPAAKAWPSESRLQPGVSLDDALAGADLVVTGTGWASDLEHRARVAARARGLRSVAVIDHWVNYAMRFERDDAVILPDEIWVADAIAAGIARKTFPETPVRELPNLYLQSQAERIARLSPPQPHGALYVLEPARDDWGRSQPGEFQALDFFAEKLDRLSLASAPIRLRPHPSDPPGKYDPWLATHADGPFEMDSGDLAGSIAAAETVVGCNSFAMVLALEAGRRVVCSLPPWAPACQLPHAGLVHLKSLD